MKYIVDRIEENYAVIELEAGKTLSIPIELIEGAKEGDSIVIMIEKKSEEDMEDTRSIFEKLRNKSK